MCGKENCWIAKCPEFKELKAKRDAGTEGAKKAEVEKAAAVTEFAGQASAVSDFMVNSTTCNTYQWNTDTGATSTMTPHRLWIRNHKPYRVPVRLADHSVIYSEGIGSVYYRPVKGRRSRQQTLRQLQGNCSRWLKCWERLRNRGRLEHKDVVKPIVIGSTGWGTLNQFTLLIYYMTFTYNR